MRRATRLYTVNLPTEVFKRFYAIEYTEQVTNAPNVINRPASALPRMLPRLTALRAFAALFVFGLSI